MATELISSGILAMSLAGIALTLATFYYAREAANAFGESTIGETSTYIKYGAVLWVGFMLLNGAREMLPDLFAGYHDLATLVMNTMLVGGMFFFAIAFNILAEVLD